MLLSSWKGLLKFAGHKNWVFAILIALSFSLPISAYAIEKHATIAPINILSGCCGWSWAPSKSVPNLIPSDVTDFVLPDRYFVKQALSHDQIPLWNPSYFGGGVFLGDIQTTVFQPVNIFDLVTNELNVQTISVVLSLFLLCFSMVLMLLELRISRAASALGGIAFAGSCFAIFWAPFGMMTWMMAAWPLTIYLFLKWQKSNKDIWLGVLAFCLGIQLYFGHIQFSFMTYVCFILFALYYFLFMAGQRSRSKKNILLTCGAVLIGVCIGAAQLLPFLAQVKIGHRAGVVLVSQPASLTAMVQDIKNFFSPYIFGPYGSQSYYLAYGPFRFSIGLLPAILALAVIIKFIRSPKKSKDSGFFIFLLLIGMLWMWNSLPQQLLDHLFSVFKSLNPGYYMAIGIFAASALAVSGLTTCLVFIIVCILLKRVS